MRISVSIIDTDDFVSLDVFPDMTINDIKGFVEADTNVSASSQHYFHNNVVISDTSKTLTELNVAEGDILIVRRQQPQRRPAPQSSNPPAPQRPGPDVDAENARLSMLGNPRMLEQARQAEPELAAAINDPTRFKTLWDERLRRLADMQRQREEQIALLEADPFNVEAQTKIEEMIRQEQVAANMQKAMEENPESFARVVMLYIDVLVNNTPIKAFVDSGAQTTIMSPDAAERCGILRLIDKRYGGIARGVGTAKILGRVHTADIQIGKYSLASSFTVMEGKDVDLLLGLDMLKRHQMCIDLKDNCLRVADEQISFLSENEMPKMMEEVLENEPKVAGPGGSTIGATTGTVEPPKGSNTSQGPSTSQSQPSSSSAQTSSQSRGTNNPSTSFQPPQSQNQIVTEEKIGMITALGFSRDDAVSALQNADGNVEIAVGLLFP